MSFDTRALLDELSGIGVGVDEDDPIAQEALAQAAASAAAELETSDAHAPAIAAAPRWRGSRILRTADRGNPEPVTESSADVADAGSESAADVPDVPDAVDDTSPPTAVELLLDIRDLMRQQVKLLAKLVGERAGVPTAGESRRRTRAEVPAAVAEAGVSRAPVHAEGVPSEDSTPDMAVDRQEQLRAAQATRLARMQEAAAQERQRLSALVAQGLSSEAAMEQLEAERIAREEAYAEAREADAAADDAPLDEVPMADSGVPGLDDVAPTRSGNRATASQGSRGGSFDVDFDVSALGAQNR
jgi:hypothetical protein